MPPAMIGPSLLACDLSQMKDESLKVLEAGADYLHIDVMDGHFVPNLSWGPPVIECLRKQLGPKPYFDVHLMVSNPEAYVTSMAEAGANTFTFHIEATEDAPALITAIKNKGMKAGIAIKPKTGVDAIESVLGMVDLALVMTVEPGFGGQSFMEDMMPKVSAIRQMYPNLDVEVDGGLGPKNIDIAAKAGANWIVAGSSVFKAQDPAEPISIMKKSVEAATA